MRKIESMKLALITFLLLSINCSKDLDVNTANNKPALVIWGFLEPDSLAAIHLSHTFPLLSTPDTSGTWVSGALVVLYDRGFAVDTLKYVSDGLYRSEGFRPVEGGVYHFTAEKTGFEQLVTSMDTMPERPFIISISKLLIPTEDPTQSIARIKSDFSQQVNAVSYRVSGYDGDGQVYQPIFYANNSQPCRELLMVPSNPYNYNTIDLRCIRGGSFIDLRSNSESTSNYLGKSFKLSITFFSDQSLKLFDKIQEFEENNIEPYSTNLFFVPVYLPNNAKGGYGFVSCFNPYTTTITF
jgi:Domain of unknown function (DUF4249)